MVLKFYGLLQMQCISHKETVSSRSPAQSNGDSDYPYQTKQTSSGLPLKDEALGAN